MGAAGAVGAAGGATQAVSPNVIHRISSVSTAAANPGPRTMWVIVLEAAAALGLLVFIVWWTMFSGRRRGERTDEDPPGS